ncbi:DNA polymerase III subunit delta [Lacihabitans sp. LS3-19]|uniref:DNA polymerase III subunit delta n=1 Tax=Lacihabitans sp. LS3-19 TaxID=2487335 RepID=UPI0020CF2447|nr:DNA polymerase III subunit delta [Lacihabitans sp. LS3-19]MCP9769950.1 DNA polymerase III subunit delta [Lacihabitans sp. LS3-19]
MANNNTQIINKLEQKTLKPLYFVHGTESFYIDSFVQKIIEIAIPDFEKGFNEYILYGKDITTGDVINYARKFPMMAEKQLIVVKEAHMISDLNNKENQALLENYAKNPLNSTILVLSFGKAQDERKTWIKAFNTHGQILNFKKMYDYEVPDFILSLCSDLKLKISPKAVQLLNEHIGNNLQAIHNEIDKLKVNLKPEEAIDANTIEKYVGISKDYNVFELQKALIEKNPKKTYQIIKYFGDNTKDHPITPNIIILYNFFSKVLLLQGLKNHSDADLAKMMGVNAYFLKDYKKAASLYPISHLMNIIHALKIADKKSKGVDAGSVSEGELYQDLIFRILY